MPDWDKVGLALQGFGEGLAGRGPQWMAAQTREKEAQAVLREQSQNRVLQNGRMALLRVRAGQHGAAQASLQSMLDDMTQGGMPVGSAAGLLRSAQEGRWDVVENELAALDNEAVSIGKMKPIGGGHAASAKTTHYDNGTTMLTLPDGSTKVYGPDGREAKGNERLTVLQRARKEQVDFAAARAGAEATGKGGATRGQEVIDFGLSAAKALPVIKRGIHLSKLVKTGGLDAARLKAKEWFGIESADEAELTSNLGKAVLSQLKSTFGSQFTEREGARLERIEANIGKSNAGNIRILDQLLKMTNKYVDHAMTRAVDIGDQTTINELLDWQDFTLDTPGQAAEDQPSGTIPLTPPSPNDIKFLGFE